MGFWKNIFNRWKEDDFFEEEELWDEEYFWQEERMKEDDEYEQPRISPKEGEMGSEDEYAQWDWNTITNDRTYLKINDPYQREKYIRSLVEEGLYDSSSFAMTKENFDMVLNNMEEVLVGSYVAMSSTFISSTSASLFVIFLKDSKSELAQRDPTHL